MVGDEIYLYAVPAINLHYASGRIENGSFHEIQYQRVSAYKRLVSMEDLLQSEVLGNSQSDKTDEEDTLIDRNPALTLSNLVLWGYFKWAQNPEGWRNACYGLLR